ncbi:MAG: amino acid adenylation domain-containing protein, partial [Bacteroidales bacterium]|nr:amino acid adenylation domain-containing protein [Bacteroidales bacterium]
MDKKNIKDIYALSPMQESMLFHHIMDQNSGAYFEQMVMDFKGEPDIEIFEKSINILIRRYDIFRTVFVYEKVKQPLQIVFKERPLKIKFEDLSYLKKEDQEKVLHRMIVEDQEKGFDLTADMLIRISVVKIGEDLHKVIWSHHHILMDGWCMGIVMKEFFNSYQLFKQGKSPDFPNTIPYSQYINWLGKQNREEAKEYWKSYLEKFDTKSSVIRSRNPKNGCYKLKTHQFSLDKNTTSKIQSLASENYVTPNIIIQTVWSVLLQKYNNVEDVVFGAVVSGRPQEIIGIEDMVGLFINTIPVRIRMDHSCRFNEALRKNQAQALESDKYSYLPLAEVQNFSSLKANLIDHIVVFENFPMEQELQELDEDQTGFLISDVESREQTSYDFNLLIGAGDELIVKFSYNGFAYEQVLINRLETHFCQVVQTVLRDPEIRIGEIDFLTEEERKKILFDFNISAKEYPKDKTIHELFEDQVRKTPDNVALVYENGEMSYRELAEKSDTLARTLRARGLEPGKIVGILTERSPEMIIGILGILKAGGAYLPLDTEYPSDRIDFILENSSAVLLLTKTIYLEKASFENTILIDKPEVYTSDESPALKNLSKPSDLAYIIYTSGSTGKPKGVMIRHSSVVNILTALHSYYPLLENDSYLLKTTYTFDVSVAELFGWFMEGGKLALLNPSDEKSPSGIIRAIQNYRVTHINFVPSMLKMLIETLDVKEAGKLNQLKYLFTAGEALSVSLWKQIKKAAPDVQFENIYGPTEITIYATKFHLGNPEGYTLTPIGVPVQNTRAYILDRNDKLAPIGVPGELCIAGDGLAMGYVNQPELTDEKFVVNPFEPGEKMYRTGDLVRWLEDGNIEYLGRIDHQVKIRGFRIELGEIESCLCNHQNIKEAIVMSREDRDDNRFLCAYYQSDYDIPIREFRDYIGQYLPDYMIPSYFVKMETMPRTESGKINRKALPEPDGVIRRDTEYVAPRNETEQKLSAIWQSVLALDKIGIDDDFFDLGGHSLKATISAARIFKELGVEVPLREIFKYSTIRQLGEYVLKAQNGLYSSIEKAPYMEYYPVSAAQKRMYLLSTLEEKGIGYNIPGAVMIEGPLEIEKIKGVFNTLIQRHETMRTSFDMIDTKVIQKIHESVQFDISIMETCESDLEKEFEAFVQPFDLKKAPLLRVAVCSINENRWMLMFDIHHIISDGTSIEVLIDEFSSLYNGDELPELQIQYKDFSVWQNQLMQSEELKKQEEYWRETLGGDLPVLNMPADYVRPVVQSFEGSSYGFRLDVEITENIEKVARENQTTLFTVLLAAYNVLLSKYSGQEDIIVGSPNAGRMHADLERVIGMFVNTLAIRNFPGSSKTFREFLDEVKENTLKAFENQDYQFEELVEKLSIKRDLSRNPLFDTMFSLQNLVSQEKSPGALKIKTVDQERTTAKFDLYLEAYQDRGGLEFHLDYCSHLFKAETIMWMCEHYVNLIGQIIKNPEILLSDITLLSEPEKEKVLVEFNDRGKQKTEERTLTELIEEQVEINPDRTALSHNGQTMTYREMNRKANQLARVLRDKGVKPGSLVGVLTDRSMDMIVGLLAVLKTGSAYVPLDPVYPVERIRFMLDDAGVRVLLVQGKLKNLYSFELEIIELDQESNFMGNGENLDVRIKPDDLAYIIYTSGSTGLPKGVMTEHRNVGRVVKNTNYINIDKDDIFLQLSSYAFDGSIFDIFGALTNGARLVLPDKDTILDIKELSNIIRQEGISIFFATTALFNTLVEIDLEGLKNVKKICFGGERVSVRHTLKALKCLGPDKLIHVYGPTESTVYATFYPIREIVPGAVTIPIGAPLGGTSLFVLDKNNFPQGIGVPGELCISGVGLARGYLNRPELTDEKFIPNRFGRDSKIYRTGDLVRWLPSGDIEFLDRIDHQVKIRGFRIELGEIENRLLQIPGITEALVIVRGEGSGDRYLCAYFVSDEEIKVEEIKRILSKNLPEYMVPTYFVNLEKFPLTANGKINHKALPEPDESKLVRNEYVAPRDETENKMAEIFGSVLGIDKIGINDHFFDLGGHSLKAMVAAARIFREFNVEVPLREIFKDPTVKGVSLFIRNSSKTRYTAIPEIVPCEVYPLSSAQKRMYVLAQLEGNSTGYNIPEAVILEGTIDREKIEEVFRKLVHRHESLRTSFEMKAGEPVQRVHRECEIKIEFKQRSEEEAKKEIQKFIRPFDFSQPPLFRVGLIQVDEQKHILIFDIHHIISDGTSLGIILEEFWELYNGRRLPELRIQYKEYAQWQKGEERRKELKRQEEYWINKYQGEIPVLALPVDYARPALQSSEGKIFRFKTEKEEQQGLMQLARENETTMYMVLLSLYSILMSKYCSQEDLVVGTPTAGRPHVDLEQVVGMFVNTITMRTQPKRNLTFIKFLMEVKETALEAYENQEYQFEELVEKLDLKRDMSRNPLFDTMFALQNIDTGNDEDEDEDEVGLKIKPYRYESLNSKFDLSLDALESEEGIEFIFEYCTRLFREETIRNMSRHLLKLIREVLKVPEKRIDEYTLINDAEEKYLIEELNSKRAEWEEDKG